MSLSANCPNCMAFFQLDEKLAGKKVKCQKCANVFTVPATAADEKTERAPVIPHMELDDAPAAKAKTEISEKPMPAPAAPPRDDEPEDDYTQPTPKPPSVKKMDKADPDSSDEPPRRKAAAKASGGVMTITVLLLTVGLLSCLGCIGVGAAWFFTEPRPPDPGPLIVANDDFMPPPDGFVPPRPALPINVFFGANGEYTSLQRLDVNDAEDALVRKPHKLYHVTLLAGRRYQIDMMSAQFDCYLILRDPNNVTVASDDDGGDGLNARITYTPIRTGRYSIIATSFARGAGPYKLTVRPVNPTDDPAKNPPLIALKANNLSYRIYNFQLNEYPLEDLIWARDGRTFHVLTKAGMVERYSADTGKVEKQIKLAQEPTASARLAMSGAGLLAWVPSEGFGAVSVFHDNDTGAVKQRISIPSLTRLAVGADAKFAVALVNRAGRSSLRMVNLERGGLGPAIPLKTFTSVIALSPDGNHLFAAEAGKLLRYRVNVNSATLEESSAPIVQIAEELCVSPDGQFVCLLGNPSINLPVGHPVRGNYVYRSDSFKKPAATLTGRGIRSVGIDAKGGWLLTNETNQALVLLTGAGQRRADVVIPGVLATLVREFSVSPRGKEALLRTTRQVVYLRLDAANAPIGQADPNPKQEGRSLVTNITKTGGFVFKTLSLRSAYGDTLTSTAPCWDADGKNLYCLDAGLTLNRINRDFAVEASIGLAQDCKHLALSSEGVAVLSTVGAEISLFDATTLARRLKINAPGARWLGASPKSAQAIVLTEGLEIADLKAGKMLATQIVGAPPAFAKFKNLALSPDGKYLFAQAGDYSLHRARIEGTSILHEATMPAPVQSTAVFQFAPDSKHMTICYPSASRITAGKKIQRADVYAIDNWKVPAYSLPTRLRLGAFAAGGGLFGDTDKNVVRFYPNPAKEELNNNSWTTEATPRCLLAAPGSNGCLVLMLGASPQWVEPVAK